MSYQKQTQRVSIARRACRDLFCRAALVAAAAVLALAAPAHAADRYWDANGTTGGVGGTGAWNLSGLNWSPLGDGVAGPYAAWSNSALDNAIFGGTAATSTVTVNGAITVHNLTFNAPGYTLNGGIVTLGGAAPTIAGGATINSVLAGSAGLTKIGNSTLILNGANTFTGAININDGTLNAINDAALGNVGNQVFTAAGKIVTLIMNGPSTGRTMTVGNGGTLLLQGAGVGSALIKGSGSVQVSGNGVTLSNDASSYTGATLFSGCTGTPCSASFTSIADFGIASSLGAADALNGTITYIQVGGIPSELNYIGDGDSSNRGWQIFSNDLAFRNKGTGTLTLTGDVFVSGGGSFNADAADIRLLGVLGGGAYSFNSLAGHTVTLGDANTFTGAATIGGIVNAATLANANLTSSLGAGTAIALNAGTLNYTGAGAGSDRTWTVATGTSSILNNGTGALDLSGTAALTAAGSALTLGGGFNGVNIYSGAISGLGGLVSDGAGTWLLNGANSFAGSVTVNGGTLKAGSASAFGNGHSFAVNGGTLDLGGFDLGAVSLTGAGGTVALGANTLTVAVQSPTTVQTYAGNIAGTGQLHKTGAGTLTLKGANTYTGATTVSGGKLLLDFSGAGGPSTNIVASSSALSLTGGTLAVQGGAGENDTQTFNGLTINAGSNTVSAASGAGGSVNLNLGAVNAPGGFVNFILPAAGTGAITTTNADGKMGAWAIANSTDYAKVVGGKIVAFDASDYTNTDDAGQWQSGQVITDVGGLGPNTPFFGTVNADTALGGLRYTVGSAATVTIAAGKTLGVSGMIIFAPSTSGTGGINGAGFLTGGPGGGALGVLQNSDNSFVSIGTQIVDNGGHTGFVKAGNGKGAVRLSGVNNSYTGATTLSGGTLQVTSLANGGVNSSIGASGASASNLVLESGVLSYIGTTDVVTDRGMTLVNGGIDRAIDIGAARTVEFSGLVTSPDNAGLSKTGLGTLVLSNAANDYVGATTITGTGSTTASSTLEVNKLANGGAASGIGAASKDSGNLVLSMGGRLRYTGGTVTIDRGFTLGAGSAGGRIDVAEAGTTLTIGGIVVGTGAFTKEGAGTLILCGNNTRTGATTVAAGILRACNSQSFGAPGTAGSMTVNAGALLDLEGFDTTIGALVGAGTVETDGAALTIRGGGTFTGAVTGSGTLAVFGGQIFNGCGNSYTGGTTIGNSTLSTDCLKDGGAGSGIGASSNAPGNLTFLADSVLNYTGLTQTVDRGFTLAGGFGNVQVNNAATTLTFTGPVVGPGSLVKRGPGTLVLSGDNTFMGPTLVQAGRLVAGSQGAFDNNGALTMSDVANAVFDVNGKNVQFSALKDANANSGGLFGGNIDLNGGTLTVLDGGGTYTGAIIGNGNLIKTGTTSQPQTLAGCSSSYTGSTTIKKGVLSVACLANGGANSSIGASSAAASNLVLDGGTLRYTGGGNSSTDRQLTLGATLGNALDASGTGLGTVNFTNTAAITFAMPNTSQALTLTGANTGDNTFAAQIINNGAGQTSLNKTGLGTWILTNSNSTYTGVTTISGGVLGVDKLTNGGTASSLGMASAAASNIIIGSGSTLRYTGAGDSTNRQFTLATGTTIIQSSGTGAIHFTDTSPLTLQGNNQARTIALAGTDTDDNSLAASIKNAGTGVTTLAKNGTGTWILTGNQSSYSGSTTVNAGSLFIDGNQSLATGLTSVASGGTLGGKGIIGGGVTVIDGGTLAPGSTDGPGTLTIKGSLALAANSTLNYEFGQAGVVGGPLNDLTEVAGNLTLDGKLNIDVPTDGTFGPGIYRVFNYGGTLTDNGLALGDVPMGSDVSVHTSIDKQVFLVNLAGLRLSIWDGDAGPKFDGHINGGDGTWTADSANDNWTEMTGAANGPYTDGSFAAFAATPGTVTVDDGAGAVRASGMQFASSGYTINGDAVTMVGPQSTIRVGDGTAASAGYTTTIASQLTGASVVEKTDLGTLILTGASNYTGTVISAGTLQLGNGGTTGSITGDVADNATLVVDRSNQVTLGGAISGSGKLNQIGTGTTILTGANTYTGGTTISAGALQIGNGGTTGSLSGNVANNTALVFDRNNSASFGGVVSGAGTLTQNGTGLLTLTGANTYGGVTTVNAGTLHINGDQSGATGLTEVASGGTLGGTGIIGGDVQVDDGGTLAPASRPGKLTINGDLALSGGSRLAYELGQANVVGGALNDLTEVKGDLTLDGTIDVTTSAGGSFDPGVYRIINYNGTLTDHTLAVGSAPSANYFVQTSVANQVNLVNTTGLTFNFWDGSAGPKNDGKVEGGGGTWQLAGGEDNWTGMNGMVNAAYTNPAFAVFQGTGGTVTVDNGNGAVTASGMQFAADGYLINGEDIGLAGTQATIRVGDGTADGAAYTATIASSLTGASELVKADQGTLILSGTNTYAGGTTITGGTLQLGSGGTTGSIMGDVADNGTLVFDRSDTATIAGTISGSGAVVQAGTGTTILTADNTHAGGTTISAGTLQLGNGGTSGWVLGDVADNGKLVIDRSDTVTLDGTVSGSGSLSQIGAGTTTLTGTNTYAGGTTISAGTLQLGDGGTSGSLMGNVADNGTLAFDRSDAVTFSGLISGSGAVHQLGSGTTILMAANSYLGTTDVDAGTLLVDGNQSAATGLTSVGAGATLGGTGTIGGDVKLADNGILNPGNATEAPGTLAIKGDLTLSDSTKLAYNFGQANVPGGPFNDLTQAGGDLVLDGKLDVMATPGRNFDPGLYRIISYGGTLTDNTLDVVSAPSPEYFVQTAIDHQVNLVNTDGLELNFWDGAAGPANDGVVQGGDGTWHVAGAENSWTDASGSVNASYENGSFAIFAGTAGTVTVDDQNGPVTAAGMQFGSDGYDVKGDALTLVGSQSIIRVGDGSTVGAGFTATIDSVLEGDGELVKTDLGTLVLNGHNTYTGGTAINGGTVKISAEDNLGNAAGGVTLDGGTLNTTAGMTLNRTLHLAGAGTFLTDPDTTAKLTGNIDGVGSLTKTGDGTLVVTGDVTHTGGTLISAGTLQVGDGGTSGSLAGNVTDNATLAFNRSDSATFGGIASGTGALAQLGHGTTILTGANTYAGGTTISAGTLQLGNGGTTGSIVGNVADNGTLAFNRSDDLSFDGVISGSGGLSHMGTGKTVLTAISTLTGATDVFAGRLSVNGSIGNSAVLVHDGGTLMGSGTVGATTVAQNGTIAPGNSIGTLNVNGNYTQQAGAIYQAEVNPTSADADRINVAGSATLDDGAIVKVVKNPVAPYVAGTRYTILTASGGLKGTFDLTGDTDLTAFIYLTDAYDANNAYLVTKQSRTIGSIGGTPNQIATGTGVTSLPADNPVQIAILNQPDVDAAHAALDLLSGEIHASTQTATIENGHLLRDAATDRLRGSFCAVGTEALASRQANGSPRTAADCDAASAPPAVWSQALGAWGHTDTDHNAAAFDRSTGGLLIGGDAPLGNWRVGAFAGLGQGTIDIGDRNSSATSGEYYLGIYGGTQWGNLGLRTGATYTWQDIATSRHAGFQGFADDLSADYHAGVTQVFADLGYRIDAGPVALEPFANLAYVGVDTDGFTEHGGAAALHSPGNSTDTVFTTLGLRASMAFDLNGIAGIARGSVGLRHASDDTTPISTLAFAGGSDFDIAGGPIARDTLLLNAGLDFALTDNTTLSLSYEGQFSGSTSEQAVKGTFDIKF
ncbi:MAG TPA: autotransporter-associated beta strand repeat-containing protein [Devosiaceae bacterium]|jgi:fibronectin-binding autotransporter adhesin